MQKHELRLLLADDDIDDCLFFKEALEELGITASLTTVSDGVELMQRLEGNQPHPDILYLDLNMPRKNGYECLSEIKRSLRLKGVPVIIYSTSFDKVSAAKLHDQGALYYIQKPSDFKNLKKVILKSIELISGAKNGGTPKQAFIIANDE